MNYYKFSCTLLKSLIFIWVIVLALALQLVVEYYNPNSFLSLFAFIMGLLVGTISGAYFYVLLSVPYLILKEFDVIKNKVAMGEFSSVDDFQEDVAFFLMKFFRFPGMTLRGVRFCFKDCEPLNIYTKADYSKIGKDLSKAEIIKNNGITVLAVPVIVGEKHLGDFYLETNTIFIRLFKNIILDFENYLLDDLLMIVILLQDKSK